MWLPFLFFMGISKKKGKNTSTPRTSCAPSPSYVYMPPEERWSSALDFLINKFPHINRDIWVQRISEGKVSLENGSVVLIETPYSPGKKLKYFREVRQEPEIPGSEEILFQSDHLLVVCKPHFMPVTPSGPYVNSSLLYRLKNKTGIEDLVPVHRLDRETAGLVMFSVKKETRGLYQGLFSENKIHKVYEAVGKNPEYSNTTQWNVETRLVKGDAWFLMKIDEGIANSFSKITLLESKGDKALFKLQPVTGKKHQLRVHMVHIGSGILNDRFYPVLYPKGDDDFCKPLQLLARKLEFTDPVSGKNMIFKSSRNLDFF